MQEITEQEKAQIIALMVREGYADQDQAEELEQRLQDGPSVKFKGYMPDCPGWCGDLFFIVWGWHDRITYASRNATEGYRIVFDGELPQAGQAAKLIMADIPLEEAQRAEERNKQMDALAPKCAWAKTPYDCTKPELRARMQYRLILKTQSEWETERGL